MGGANSRTTRLCYRYGGGRKHFRKIIGKTTLGWLTLRIPRFGFGYDGEWQRAEKLKENHEQENYFGLVQSNDHQALLWIWW